MRAFLDAIQLAEKAGFLDEVAVRQPGSRGRIIGSRGWAQYDGEHVATNARETVVLNEISSAEMEHQALRQV